MQMWFAGGDGDSDEGRFYRGVVTACTAGGGGGGGGGENGSNGWDWRSADLWECVTVKWEDDPEETQVRLYSDSSDAVVVR